MLSVVVLFAPATPNSMVGNILCFKSICKAPSVEYVLLFVNADEASEAMSSCTVNPLNNRVESGGTIICFFFCATVVLTARQSNKLLIYTNILPIGGVYVVNFNLN